MEEYTLSGVCDAPIIIRSPESLRAALLDIGEKPDGHVVALERSGRDYIRARAKSGLWWVWRRRGGWWTKQSFTSLLSTEWSEREMRIPFSWKRMFYDPYQDLFSAKQTAELFLAHYRSGKYPYPYLGA